jgi:hypothetical protein
MHHQGIRYEERGPAVNNEAKQARARKMIRERRSLGYHVELLPAPSGSPASSRAIFDPGSAPSPNDAHFCVLLSPVQAVAPAGRRDESLITSRIDGLVQLPTVARPDRLRALAEYEALYYEQAAVA